MNSDIITKKVSIHRRIFATFSAVLFFSFLLATIIFNIAMYLVLEFGGDLPLLASEYDELPYARGSISRINVVLVISIIVMFIVSLVATYLLSNSLTRPIEKLRSFALGIGKGNFTPNDFEFDEVELDDLNSALNKSIEQLGAYDNEQKIFFQNASHELRTPLTSIKVHADGIVYGMMEPKKAGETISLEADRLTDLVNDLLYVAQVDNISTAYTKKSINLIELIFECVERQKAVADKVNVELVLDCEEQDIVYECLPELISRAIDNLISNAVRYAKETVSLSCHKKGEHIEIIVSDDGVGIEPDIFPHVFERFIKGKGGNTGIGLSIVKSIVEQHGGTVSAGNSKEGGAVFKIRL